MTTPAEIERRLSSTEHRLDDVERRTRQHRGDVDALYGLVRDLDQKVTEGFADVNGRLDSLETKVDQGFAKVDQGFAAILAELRNRE